MRRSVNRKVSFRDRDVQERREQWYEQQNKDKQWIEDQAMPTYTEAFEGFLNDNAKGIQKNAKAPRYRSSGSGKSAMVALVDIPKGSVVSFAAWGGKGQYGPYIQLKGQVVEPDHMPQEHTHQQPDQQQSQDDPFDDQIPF